MEEAFSEIVGLSIARTIWLSLEQAYGNSSMERIQTLHDQLRHLTNGNLTICKFGRRFKNMCNQLSSIGQPVDESNKTHWFLCGLKAIFETFSTAFRASLVPPIFRDLLAQADGHEMFLQSIHGSSSHVDFASQQDNHHPPLASPQTIVQPPHLQAPSLTQQGTFPASAFHGKGGRTPLSGRGRSRLPPHCQLCRINGHHANSCT